MNSPRVPHPSRAGSGVRGINVTGAQQLEEQRQHGRHPECQDDENTDEDKPDFFKVLIHESLLLWNGLSWVDCSPPRRDEKSAASPPSDSADKRRIHADARASSLHIRNTDLRTWCPVAVDIR